ncbi:uracil-DNA glycosylase [Rhizobium bangladeshense]|uniref:Uracil-DNA glycosylase n=1 Tax=Rhizobium bangladeshense TaxID=1138189 RepID=A0ABS7LCV6_9HYPH|nr:uracil-DNA glycosylase [Rhizobium bangladeshense]MBX4870903.1 uracil-DNA glycosylase [Rhizobium bangladeshense]MBX4876387.1 uracil-DNA glycosylase [Rhizobium bangladeshense]MBX4887351.1 uracil-DNA glycosylase [Rhizobium bangladeshense]MBX4930664.1 uracil-DNA glycosylase [Rhizobium bangladeshense]MBY3581034.1 uracil-DNA glycosylase [Rhizobium bangladeshense]
MGQVETFVERIAAVKLENCFNPYADTCEIFDRRSAPLIRRQNLLRILCALGAAGEIDVWVGRDLGYRGGRRTGLALTDEHSLELYAFHLKVFSLERSTHGPPVKERTAASVYRVLTAVNIPILTWNVFPLHPHESGKPMSNRQHTRSEAELGFSFLEELCTSFPVRNLIAIGNDAAVWTQRLAPRNLCVRHPSYGGQTIFLKQMNEIYGQRIESYGQGGAI